MMIRPLPRFFGCSEVEFSTTRTSGPPWRIAFTISPKLAKGYGMKRVTLWSVLILALVGCGGSSLGPSPLDLNGQYSIFLNPTTDTCGFDLTGVSGSMLVTETGPGGALVDVPVAGACNLENYTRVGDMLASSGTEALELSACGGICNLQTDFTHSLTFTKGGGVTGTETSAVSAVSGTCDCISLPCQISVSLSGNMCNGCYSCAKSSGVPAGKSFLSRMIDQPKPKN